MNKPSTETIHEVLKYLMEKAYGTAKRRGKIKNRLEDSVMDIISECVEAVSASGPYWYAKDGKPEGYVPELMDVLIATLSTVYQYAVICAPENIPNPSRSLLEKMTYNERRDD